MTTQTTVAEETVYELDPVKGSRFVASIGPVEDENEALAFVFGVANRWPQASHHCWAYRLADGRARSNDDGEPGGSAGRPILAQIEGHGLTDLVVVVSRWFGGTKLGVGGLIRAYGGCAGKGLDQAPLLERIATELLACEVDWSHSGEVQTVIARDGLEVVESTYTERVRWVLRVPTASLDAVTGRLVDATRGQASLEVLS